MTRTERPPPSPTALEHARDVAARIRDRNAPIRVGFIERLTPTAGVPPLAFMLRGGQGGEVRLKLLLSLLWFSARPPHETEYPARGWAALLDLDEPDTNGARRVNAAFAWLARNDLVRVASNRGQPTTVYLMDERRTGEAYVPPHKSIEALKADGATVTRDNYYVTLLSSFWTKGWVSVLTAPAVAMLLVMMSESRYSRSTTRLWHSPRQAADRFALSQDSRSAGLRELERYQIVSMKPAPISPGVFDFRRMRNVYNLHLETLTVEPGQSRPIQPITVAEFLALGSEVTESDSSEGGNETG